MRIIEKLKQPHIIALSVTVIAQILVRFGVEIDSATIEEVITGILNLATIIAGIVVAYKSDKDSII